MKKEVLNNYFNKLNRIGIRLRTDIPLELQSWIIFIIVQLERIYHQPYNLYRISQNLTLSGINPLIITCNN